MPPKYLPSEIMMKERQPIAISVLALALGGLIAWVVGMSFGESENAKVVDACKKIQIGMTEDQVRQTMGAPIKTLPFEDGGRKTTILIFPSSASASTAPQVEIDANTYKVVEVICDEDYRLPHPK